MRRPGALPSVPSSESPAAVSPAVPLGGSTSSGVPAGRGSLTAGLFGAEETATANDLLVMPGSALDPRQWPPIICPMLKIGR